MSNFIQLKSFKITAVAAALALAGCGGGSVDSIAPQPDIGIQNPSSSGGNTGGNNTGGTTTPSNPQLQDVNVSLSLQTSTSRTIDSTGATAKVKVTDKEGNSIENAKVVFNGTGLKYIGSNDGSTLTDSNGIATMEIKPADGANKGTYDLTATATDSKGNSATTDPYFYQLEPAIDNVDVNVKSISISTSELLDTSDNPIKPGNPIGLDGAKYKVTVTDQDDEPVQGAKVSFSIDSDGVSLNKTTSGYTLTDKDGNAEIFLKPNSPDVSGAYTITVNATYNGQSTSSEYVFSVNPTKVSFSPPQIGNSNLESGGQTPISFTVKDENDKTLQGVSVKLNASCGSVPQQVVSDSDGKVEFVYKAVNSDNTLCEGAVNVTASTDSKTSAPAKLQVAKAKANSILFTSGALTMGVKGSGSSSSGKLEFTVYANNAPLANQIVRISKTKSSPRDLKVGKPDNTEDSVLLQSDSNGVVSVNLYPGYKSGPVEILAELMDVDSVSAVTNTTKVRATALSKNVSVAIGRATQEGLSISMSKNVLKEWVDGDVSVVTARVNDRWGNSVPDGTIVSFTAEGGKIDSNCSTVNGVCNVNFSTQNPRPINGRISVVAYVEGNKAYEDSDNNNMYDIGEKLLHNIGNFFRDDNENGKLDAGERLYEKDLKGSKTNCAPSSFKQPNSGDCDDQLSATLRHQFILGIGSKAPSVYSENPIKLNGQSIYDHTFYMYGNKEKTMYMPSGTTISVSAEDNTEQNENCEVKLIGGKESVDDLMPLEVGKLKVDEEAAKYSVRFKNCSKGDVFELIVTPTDSNTITMRYDLE